VFRKRSRPADEPEALPAPAPQKRIAEKPEAPVSPALPPPTTEKRAVALLRKEDVDQSSGRATGALLGRGSRFEGKLTFEGTVEIEGQFVGDIISRGHLTVGTDAKVEGTIQVQSAVFSGEVGGSITTTGALELKATARVTGDLNVESLVVEKGAFFEGTVKMRKGDKGIGRPMIVDAGEAPPVVAPPKRPI
jgi:cytoskeletal protein CcmA (bactofilin family)